MIEIEKSVPLPTVAANSKYPFRAMSVGDSFFVGGDQATQKLSVSSCQFGRRNPEFKFKVRSVDGGARCWRVE